MEIFKRRESISDSARFNHLIISRRYWRALVFYGKEQKSVQNNFHLFILKLFNIQMVVV